MDSFKERERGYESMYAHLLESRFLARVRGHYQAGLWAAGLLGKTGEDAEDYAEKVRMEDIRGRGKRAVAERLVSDLEGIATAEEIDEKLFELRARAEHDLIDSH